MKTAMIYYFRRFYEQKVKKKLQKHIDEENKNE